MASTFNERHEQLSLKVQYVEFDISVPPVKMYFKTLKIALRPYNVNEYSMLSFDINPVIGALMLKTLHRIKFNVRYFQ